jgi:hypothetical protein
MSFNHFIVKGYLGCVEMNFNKRGYLFKLKNEVGIKTDLVNDRKDYGEFVNPSIITNAIIKIDSNKSNLKHINQILNYLQHLLCKHIVIDFECKTSIEDLKLVFDSVNSYNIHEAMLLLNYSDELYSDDFADLILSSNRFNSIIIFNSPFNKNLENFIHYFQQPRQANNFNKNKTEFVCNLELYTESLFHHSYFNRKLYIDKNGDIKNAPECQESFGSILGYSSVEELKRQILNPLFKKYWHINKEICDICKDCEYRYMCVDNRIPFQRSNEAWYHKIECNYNPYICKWEGEEGYRTLKECGIVSNEEGFSIDQEKIKSINKELWQI